MIKAAGNFINLERLYSRNVYDFLNYLSYEKDKSIFISEQPDNTKPS